ncbi:DinB family protein [Sphingobacterium sp. LRF_L2]|uniref:DinB family protein n=1 Tax=Sphingobacterium sp. LRF_L2 TaxID=3369421 RepID=UPI003F62FEC4
MKSSVTLIAITGIMLSSSLGLSWKPYSKETLTEHKDYHLASDVNVFAVDSLLQYFEEMTLNLKNQVSDLNEAQLQFKPQADKWSISQCLEHIVLSEKMLFEMAKEELKKDPKPEEKVNVQVSDTQLKSMMTDRNHKFSAPEELQPTGKYKDVKTAWNDFEDAREPVLVYIREANSEDLRNHISDFPTGKVDGYQNLLFIAAHCARRTKQIEEIKAHPNFPKKQR